MVLRKGICGPKPRVTNIKGTNLKSLKHGTPSKKGSHETYCSSQTGSTLDSMSVCGEGTCLGLRNLEFRAFQLRVVS